MADLYLPEVATAEDVADHLHLSLETVRRKLRDGELVGRKLGRRWYVTRRALLSLLEEGSGSPPGARKRPTLFLKKSEGDA